MNAVTILSGPIGAGKTTVARELLSLLPQKLAYIEGDTFWSFIAKGGKQDRRKNFHVIMRSMTAATIPFARSGYDVLLDFSIPPDFLDTARKILKEVPLNYVVLLPSMATCESRAAMRLEGAIHDYRPYREFYALFDAPGFETIEDEVDAKAIAKRIRNGLDVGSYLVHDKKALNK